jgi:hypothetical protein
MMSRPLEDYLPGAYFPLINARCREVAMGEFRFRRTIRLLPGVHLNISKTGVSLSLGGPGATINFNKEGTQTTFGLPGSGLNYRGDRTPWSQEFSPQGGGSMLMRFGWVVVLALAAALYVYGAPRLATALAIVGGVHFVLWAVSTVIRLVRRPATTITPIASPPPGPGSSGED